MGANGTRKEVVKMSNKQFNGYLETIAKLLDALGHHEAAEIVRQAKI